MYKKKIIISLYSIWKQWIIFRYNFITKINLFNINLIPFIGKLVITIQINSGLKSDSDVKIIDTLLLLDYLSNNNKASIEKLITKYVKKNKTIVFITKSTLVSWYEIYLFLYYLKFSIVPYLNKKLLTKKYSLMKNSFILIIPDISSLEDLPNFLRNLNINIKISFFFKHNLNKKLIFYFYKYLGV